MLQTNDMSRTRSWYDWGFGAYRLRVMNGVVSLAMTSQ